MHSKSVESLSSDENLDLRVPNTPHTFLEYSDMFRNRSSRGLLHSERKEMVNTGRRHTRDSYNLKTRTQSKHKIEKSEKFAPSIGLDLKPEILSPSRQKPKVIKTNFLRFIGKILKIIVRIRKNLKYTKMENLNQRQLEIINDYAFFRELERKPGTGRKDYLFRFLHYFLIAVETMLRRVLKIPEDKSFTAKFSKFFPVFKPSGRFKLYWNFFVLVIIAIQLFTLSIELFVDQTIRTQFRVFEYASIAIFLLDIAFTFNTGYYNSGDVILSRWEISKKYFTTVFWYDFVSVLALIIPRIYEHFSLDYNQCSENKGAVFFGWIFILRAFFFMKIKDWKIIYSNLEEYLFNEEKYEKLLSLVKLSIEILLFSHFLACIWIFIPTLSSTDPSKTWLSKVEALDFNSPWHFKYLYSLYWSFSTLFTVGYGDISAKNELEVGFSMVAIIFGCLFFAYAINSIGTLIDESNKKNKQLRSELRTINNHLKRNNVKSDLRIKVRKYLEHLFYEEGTRNAEKESVIMNKLSNSLREEVLIQIYGRIIDMFPFFLNNFSNDLLDSMAKIMKTVRFAPGDIIFNEEDANNGFMYFLVDGQVELYVNCEKRLGEYVKLKNVRPVDYFGLSTFFTGDSRKYSARSVNFSTLFTLNREELIAILATGDQSDWESFHSIKDNILLYNTRLHDLNESCEACKEEGHAIFKCPYMQFKPNREHVILRHLHTKDQERKPYVRGQLRSHNAWHFYTHWEKQMKEDKAETWKPLLTNVFTEVNEIEESEREDEYEEVYSRTNLENTCVINPKSSDCLVKHSVTGSETVEQEVLGFNSEYVHNLGASHVNLMSTGVGTVVEKPMRNSSKKIGSLSQRQKSTITGSEPKNSASSMQEINTKENGDLVSNSPTATNALDAQTYEKGSLNLFEDFDRMCNFNAYFPHNNAASIISYFASRLKLKRKKLLKKNNTANSQAINSNLSRTIKVDAFLDLDEQRKFYIKEQKKNTLNVLKSPRRRKRPSNI